MFRETVPDARGATWKLHLWRYVAVLSIAQSPHPAERRPDIAVSFSQLAATSCQ